MEQAALEPHSIEEPVEDQQPAWAKDIAPQCPEVDRASLRMETQPTPEERDARREKSHELAQRMAMTSLREVANQSARNALAEHTQRKLRSKMWIDGTLGCIALGMGGAYLNREISEQISWQTYGWIAIVVGAVAIIEMVRTFIRWQRSRSLKRSSKRSARNLESRYERYTHQEEAAGRMNRPAQPVSSRK